MWDSKPVAIINDNITAAATRDARALTGIIHAGSRTTGCFACCAPSRAGVVGVELSRDLGRVAARALRLNMTRLGPLVLPLGEKLRYAGR